QTIDQIRDARNTAIMVQQALPGWSGADSTRLDTPGQIDPIPHPYGEDLPCADNKPVAPKKPEAKAIPAQPPRPKPW
ncbi:YgiQ family radical SAM protein, partial [Salmonella enterica]